MFNSLSFKLTSSWPPARGRGVANCGPYATSAGSGRSAGEFREAIFYVQAQYFRHICSELDVHFLTNPRKSPWAPQGTPRDPQGDPNLSYALFHTPFSYAFSYAFFIFIMIKVMIKVMIMIRGAGSHSQARTRPWSCSWPWSWPWSWWRWRSILYA